MISKNLLTSFVSYLRNLSSYSLDKKSKLLVDVRMASVTLPDNEEGDFERALAQLACDMICLCYWERPAMFNWYYNDFLHTNVRFVGIINDKIECPKWLYPYEFWCMSMGPVIQTRHFFKIRFWNGFYVVFYNEESYLFEDEQSLRIEEMLREDDGVRSTIGMVRAICESTGVLLLPQFVSLSRRARAANDDPTMSSLCD